MINGIDYLKKMYPNKDEEDFQPAGVDLRLGQIYELSENKGQTQSDRMGLWVDGYKELPSLNPVAMDEYAKKYGDNGWLLLPNRPYIAEVQDRIEIGKHNAQFYLPRSSLLRAGVNVYTALGDNGYSGKLSFLVINHSSRPFFLEKGVRFAQLIDFEVRGSSKSYDGDYQNDKHKR